MNFPLYEMRHFYRIFDEGEYKLVQTNKNVYILDLVDNGTIPELSDRRLEILIRGADKPLYPLKNRIETYSALMKSKKRVFIDKYGKIVRWTPEKFYPVKTVLIEEKWQTSDGSWRIKPKGYSNNFKVSDGNFKYVRVVEYSPLRCFIYELTDTKLPNTRMKL